MTLNERTRMERAPSGALSSVRKTVASASLAGAAVIHAAQIRAHGDSLAEGLFFVVVAIAQAMLALAVVRTESWRARSTAMLVSAAVLSVWALSRSVGVPVGSHAGMPEPVGVADATAALLEGVTISVLFGPATDRFARTAAVSLAPVVVVGALVAAFALRSPLLHGPRGAEQGTCRAHRSPASYVRHSHDHPTETSPPMAATRGCDP